MAAMATGTRTGCNMFRNLPRIITELTIRQTIIAMEIPVIAFHKIDF